MPELIRNKKEYLLLVLFFVLLIFSYQFAFKKTWKAYKVNKSLSASLNKVNLNYQPDYLHRRNSSLDKVLSKYSLKPNLFRGSAIAQIANLAEKENVKLVEIPATAPELNTAQSQVQRLNFEGDYYSLLSFVHKLQKQNNIGVVRSLNLKVGTNYMPGVDKKLILELYFQILST